MIHAVVMAGGSGKRFWPASRRSKPKQLLSLLGERSLLERTLIRAAKIADPGCVWVATTANLADQVKNTLPAELKYRLLIELEGRDTAPCAVLATATCLANDPEAVVVMMPADHMVGDDTVFAETIKAGAAWATKNGGLVTFGIKPTRPETGYGYVELGKKAGEASDIPVFRVLRFTEKPDRETAARWVEAGNFMWNSGIFAWKGTEFQATLQKVSHELAEGFSKALAHSKEGDTELAAKECLKLPRISVDYAVMEKAPLKWCLPAKFTWSDVGSWQALWEVTVKDRNGNATVTGKGLSLDSRNCLIYSDGPAVVLLGVEGLAVVATSDAILVASLDRSQEVKKAVEKIREEGLEHLL